MAFDDDVSQVLFWSETQVIKGSVIDVKRLLKERALIAFSIFFFFFFFFQFHLVLFADDHLVKNITLFFLQSSLTFKLSFLFGFLL
ncbi:hypothetical protein CROQUDRAFT_466308 [Cronartium quercuum f. sp. fusiforme G11]|uniref:Uncharacterized protein n=1 Tax=Cronartium quercuum f. sp. fusiforme G11 TaxID=708437 RepID=A0A9P6NR16_9BASI|nr:hypothetical protein CROQUDRAFT_466308 [Cronartium quercuum f. sp. fusiforme G11]